MSALRNATRRYTQALEAASSAKRQLTQARQALALLDAELSETINEAKDDAGKPLYSNADSRKAALLTHPTRLELAQMLHALELETITLDARLETAKIEWQAERLVFAAENGVVAV
jgi:hypothetical protein